MTIIEPSHGVPPMMMLPPPSRSYPITIFCSFIILARHQKKQKLLPNDNHEVSATKILKTRTRGEPEEEDQRKWMKVFIFLPKVFLLSDRWRHEFSRMGNSFAQAERGESVRQGVSADLGEWKASVTRVKALQAQLTGWCALVGCKVKGTALTTELLGKHKREKRKGFVFVSERISSLSISMYFRLPFFFLSSPSVCLATRNNSERFGTRWTPTHKKKALKNRREARRSHKNNLRLLFELQKF